MNDLIEKSFLSKKPQDTIKSIGKVKLVEALKKMLKIRHFETRAESAYQQGKIGGFFHSYIGQEAIQTAAIEAFGLDHWYITSYRCHALALLLGATEKELMSELYGKANGNAKGRGGSMHFYTDRLLGGFGIVGGQIPIATGAAFRNQYLGIKSEYALCFLGDGAVPQGAFHESLNLAALWKLPCIYIIENNQWGMGTAVEKAVANVEHFVQSKSASYGMKGYRFDGMDFLACCAGFSHIKKEIEHNPEPILIECVTERFKGHSISDPGLYRPKEDLQRCMQKDPIIHLKNLLLENNLLTEEEFKSWDKQYKDLAIEAMAYADQSEWPDPIILEEDVFAP